MRLSTKTFCAIALLFSLSQAVPVPEEADSSISLRDTAVSSAVNANQESGSSMETRDVTMHAKRAKDPPKPLPTPPASTDVKVAYLGFKYHKTQASTLFVAGWNAALTEEQFQQALRKQVRSYVEKKQKKLYISDLSTKTKLISSIKTSGTKKNQDGHEGFSYASTIDLDVFKADVLDFAKTKVQELAKEVLEELTGISLQAVKGLE